MRAVISTIALLALTASAAPTASTLTHLDFSGSTAAVHASGNAASHATERTFRIAGGNPIDCCK